MGFLVHQRGAELSSTSAVIDGSVFMSGKVAFSAPLRRVVHLFWYVLVHTRLGKIGREKASFSDHMKEEFGFCPLTGQILR